MNAVSDGTNRKKILQCPRNFHAVDLLNLLPQSALDSPRIDTEVLKWDPRRAAQGQRPRWSAVNNSHMFEWVLGCAGDAKSYSPFEIGARITEVGMLGVLALRMQKPVVWDAENRRAVGMPEADDIIDPEPSTNAYLPH